MKETNELKVFDNKRIRTKWISGEEKWYFSVVDVIAVLTDSDYQRGRKYWKTLKMRLNKEESQLVTDCYQLKMRANDGKLDAMDVKRILRLIQSIPSKKAEPFKLWLARVGREIKRKSYCLFSIVSTVLS